MKQIKFGMSGAIFESRIDKLDYFFGQTKRPTEAGLFAGGRKIIENPD